MAETILVADDESDIRDMLALALGTEDFDGENRRQRPEPVKKRPSASKLRRR